jgi:hypothetical protein
MYFYYAPKQFQNTVVMIYFFYFYFLPPQAFDSYFLLNWLHKQKIQPQLTMRGAKILHLELPAYKIRLLDSLSYMQMSLRSIPKALGLPVEVKKGEWPYLLNQFGNMGKKWSCLPPESYFDQGSMRPEHRAEFKKWHAQNRMKSFDFDENLIKYCQSDVTILKHAVLRFREFFMEMTDCAKAPGGIDPYDPSFTIASACNRVFRTLFLQPDTIGLIPAQGYNPIRNQSVAALRWMRYLNESLNLQPPIQHARNGG